MSTACMKVFVAASYKSSMVIAVACVPVHLLTDAQHLTRGQLVWVSATDACLRTRATEK